MAKVLCDNKEQQVQDRKKSSSSGQIKTSEWFPRRLTPFLTQDSDFAKDRLEYANLTLAKKRSLYSCGHAFVTLDKLQTWAEEPIECHQDTCYDVGKYLSNSTINGKVSLWLGDISRLEIDAVVNSAIAMQVSSTHGPPRTVHKSLHEAAGPLLGKECRQLQGCLPGDAKVTFGYNLPAKLVIHAVCELGGKDNMDKEVLKCYQNCLEAVLNHGISSVAFCCIGTGKSGYSREAAAHVALRTIREWLEIYAKKVERIIFCAYKQKDWDIYNNLLHCYFPLQIKADKSGATLSSPVSRREEEIKKKQKSNAEMCTEGEKTGADDTEKQLMIQRETIEQLQQQNENQQQEIHRLSELVHQQENRIQELEQSVEASQEREASLEQELHQTQLQLTNSDQLFQDIFQRLLGQLPQSLPHWVVQRNEIQLTSEQLGVGGWATVKVALFRGQRVAAKCLHNQIISPHNIRLFTREMNMAARARHPNLLQFIGATMDNEPIILTELMPTSLRHVLEQGDPLSRGQIISIASDVARALNYLHLTNPDPIIHRDVSSANVLLKQSGNNYEAKLSDYGSANFARSSATIGPGNPLYSAPEVNDPKQHSPKMDIYSFGVLLVEMCSGELFDDIEELICTHVNWHKIVPIIRSCTNQDPKRRPNASDIILQLEHL